MAQTHLSKKRFGVSCLRGMPQSGFQCWRGLQTAVRRGWLHLTMPLSAFLCFLYLFFSFSLSFSIPCPIGDLHSGIASTAGKAAGVGLGKRKAGSGRTNVGVWFWLNGGHRAAYLIWWLDIGISFCDITFISLSPIWLVQDLGMFRKDTHFPFPLSPP